MKNQDEKKLSLVEIELAEALDLLFDTTDGAWRVYFKRPHEFEYKRVSDYKWVFDSGSDWNQLDKVILFKEVLI